MSKHIKDSTKTEKLKKKKKKLPFPKKSFEFICHANDCWEEKILLKSLGKVKSRFVSVIVSGLESDRQGEMMSQEGIDDMIVQYKSGTIPFFSDHGVNATGQVGNYMWKGIMGVWVNAVQEGKHLKATLRLNEAHPDADMFFDFIKNEMPVGFSIGANLVDEPTMMEVEE